MGGAIKSGEIVRYNDMNYVSDVRKLLKQKTNEIQEMWIKECEEELNKLKSIVVKVKY